MKCPLLSDDCAEAGCVWWDEGFKRCVVQSIAAFLSCIEANTEIPGEEIGGEMETYELETKIPDLPDQNDQMSDKQFALVIDESQLWQIYIALERLKGLKPPLQAASNKMAREICKLGKRIYKWY